MMTFPRNRFALFAAIIVLAGCAPGGGRQIADTGAGSSDSGTESGRTLTVSVRNEPSALPFRALTFGGGSPSAQGFLFHAGLAIEDERAVPRPQLAEALPALNTDSWRLMTDGRMETTYRLRSGVGWHDGTPLSAEDFVLGWRVYSTPGFGAEDRPFSFMEDVVAADARTVVIRWNQPYPDAAATVYARRGFAPLPRHIVQSTFEQGTKEAFESHPWWTREFIGLGPYRLDRWEPGAFAEGTAFEGYVLGRPKISRVKLVWVNDANTAVAHLLSGAIDFATDDSVGFEQAAILRQRWGQQGGSLLLTPSQTQIIQTQFRPEHAVAALRDLQVRRAIVHAADRQSVVDGVLNGEPAIADTFVSRQAEYYPELERVLTKYPYDVGRADTLMREAGFSKDSGGLYADSAGNRVSAQLWAVAAEPSNRIAAILSDGWRRAGIDVEQHLIPATQFQDRELNATFPGFRLVSKQVEGDSPFVTFTTKAIGTAANRWMGTNYGGYSNPEFDRLVDIYQSSLDRAERNRATTGAMKLISEEVPGFALYYSYRVAAHIGGLMGPKAGTQEVWNINEWEWATR